MTCDVEHLFICLFAICMSSLVRSVKVFGPFFNQVVCFSVFDVELYEFFILNINTL